MLTRDARNAGTFGCFNMASGRDFPVLTSGLTSSGLKINNTEFTYELVEDGQKFRMKIENS